MVKKVDHDIKDTIDKAVEALQPRVIENKVTIKQNLDKHIKISHDPIFAAKDSNIDLKLQVQ